MHGMVTGKKINFCHKDLQIRLNLPVFRLLLSKIKELSYLKTSITIKVTKILKSGWCSAVMELSFLVVLNGSIKMTPQMMKLLKEKSQKKHM